MIERLAERFQLGLHGAARIGGKLVRKTLGRGVRAVRGREGIIDENVAEPCEFLDECRIVFFFFLVSGSTGGMVALTSVSASFFAFSRSIVTSLSITFPSSRAKTYCRICTTNSLVV